MADVIQAPDNVVSSHGAARALNVTPQTIANWGKKGMLAVAGCGKNAAGHQLYDLAKIRAWASANVGWVHGGKRKNSGRKPGLWAAAKAAPVTPATAAPSTPSTPSNSPTAAAHAAGKTAPLVELGEDGEPIEDVDTMFRLAEEGRLAFNKVQALKALMDAKLKKQQYDLESGVLMDSREWATELARFLGQLRQRIEAMPARLTQTLAATLAINAPEQLVAVRAALTGEVEAFVRDVHDFAKQKEGEKNGTEG
jgi:hypothetical protein